MNKVIVGYEKIDYLKFSQLIGEKLKEKDMSIFQLSEELGWSREMAHIILSGFRSPPKKYIAQLISYFGISVGEIPINELNDEEMSFPGNRIFISYSHKDKDYLERLMIHLKPLERQGLVDTWVDTSIKAGSKWKKEIESALKQTKIAILMVSADFLASDFIIENELPPLLHAAEGKGTLVIPVILKPCRFKREKNLRDFQAINSPDEPLSLLSDNQRELIFDAIAQRIEDDFLNHRS